MKPLFGWFGNNDEQEAQTLKLERERNSLYQENQNLKNSLQAVTAERDMLQEALTNNAGTCYAVLHRKIAWQRRVLRDLTDLHNWSQSGFRMFDLILRLQNTLKRLDGMLDQSQQGTPVKPPVAKAPTAASIAEPFLPFLPGIPTMDDLTRAAKASVSPPVMVRASIKLDKNMYSEVLPHPVTMTGRQLLTLANKTPETHKLIQQLPNGTRNIEADDTVELQGNFGVARFKTLPRSQTGG